MRSLRMLAAACCALSLGGCAGVAPYQRGYLARPDMALEPTPGAAEALDKTFSAKEAAHGGAAIGGGGCGCN